MFVCHIYKHCEKKKRVGNKTLLKHDIVHYFYNTIHHYLKVTS